MDDFNVAENVRKACFCVEVGCSKFLIPVGDLERFVRYALSSGNSVTIEFGYNKQFSLL